MVPLCDLSKGKYKGEEGGLYPGGSNTPPAAHLKAGLALASKIAPIDGKIVLLSIGMSNTTQEFSTFQKIAAADSAINPKLLIVDGAQGGQTASITAQPQSNFWKEVDRRLAAAGATAAQVQVVWMKQANAGPTAEFPTESKKLQADIVATLHNLHDRFPNLKIAYLSSRIYAGFASTPLNPEPHAYETAFAVKWAVADQIAGSPELDASRSPWIAWGPYLWADGLKGRKDGLTYSREDLGPDGTHPATSGREKVARQLLQFLKTEPTAIPWFLKIP
jgi:lysophospholipase L1-like esterase